MSSAVRKPPSPFAIEQAMKALAEARERLLSIYPTVSDDDKLYLDCLEGDAEGDPFGVLAEVARASLEADDMAVMAGLRAKELAARKARFEGRARLLKNVAGTLLGILGLKRLEREDFTIRIQDGVSHVVPTKPPEELPSRFQRITIEANKLALSAALKAGETDVPAEWSNPQPFIVIQRG